MSIKLKKKVNVYPRRPLFFGNFEIRRNKKDIEMTIGNIYNSLLAMAKVEEVLSDGTIIALNMKNYNKDNSIYANNDSEKISEALSNDNGENITNMNGEILTNN